MKKGKFWITFVTFSFIAVGALLLRIGFDDRISAKQKERNMRIKKNNQYVGECIVLRNDTIKIVDYHKWRNQFILEGGKKAPPSMVKTLKIKCQ